MQKKRAGSLQRRETNIALIGVVHAAGLLRLDQGLEVLDKVFEDFEACRDLKVTGSVQVCTDRSNQVGRVLRDQQEQGSD